MKKEITRLLKQEEGTLKLNNLSRLRRWSKDLFGEKVDMLVLDFETVNNVRYGVGNTEIKSRDYEGVLEEVKNLTEQFLECVKLELINNLENGYNPYK